MKTMKMTVGQRRISSRMNIAAAVAVGSRARPASRRGAVIVQPPLHQLRPGR